MKDRSLRNQLFLVVILQEEEMMILELGIQNRMTWKQNERGIP